MKNKTLIILSSLSLGILSGVGYSFLGNTSATATDEQIPVEVNVVSEGYIDQDEALEIASEEFEEEIELIDSSKFPIEIDEETSEIVDRDLGYLSLHNYYFNETEGVVFELEVMNSDNEIIDDENGVEEIKLENGETAQYTNNGAVEIISWSEGDLSYMLTVYKDEEPQSNSSKVQTSDETTFGSEELIDIIED